jgi:TolA-binding protein
MNAASRTLLLRCMLWGLLALCARAARAQQPAHYTGPAAELAHARELFDKAQYAAALFELDRIAESRTDPWADLRTEAEFWGAICAVRLQHQDATGRLLDFIDHHPENLHVPAVRLELFRHWFSKKRWGQAIAAARDVVEQDLEGNVRLEFLFKRGYANFMDGHMDAAQTDFAQVKDQPGVFGPPATYYTAHIHYVQRNYAAALEGFTKLKEDPDFGRIVPYYIAQVQFLQGHYDALLEYVQPLLADPDGAKRTGDINRLAGEAYFRTGQYDKALPYLEKSLQRSGAERGDRYIAGYAWYKNGDWQKALTQFTQVVNNSTDSLAQLAAYHMADCYLQQGQKNYARNAFKKAYDLSVDPTVTEDALFNYAKLAYELSFDPYSEAIIALRDYMAKYPRSPRHDEAQEFLLDVYLKTRNYEAALTALDAIRTKDLRLRTAYQKLAFDRAVELYEARKYDQAIAFLDRSLKDPVDQQAAVAARYWAAECEFAQGRYDDALHRYDAVRNSGGAYASELYEQAGYGMGYCFFKQKNYAEAATSFRRATDADGLPKAQRNDAMVRTGDCYFATKDEANAISWYDKAIAAGASAGDYAMYQKGVCQGLLKRFDEKIATLKKLLSLQPNSQYAADAKFQLGETYLNLDQDDKARPYYAEVADQYPNSPHVRTSMLQCALIDKRQGRTDQALLGFKAVVAKYPTADGAHDALAGIERIYVDQGKVADYEAYVRSLDFVDPATLDLDENYYRSAEQLYFSDQCDKAIGAFGDYLAKYPKGAYAVNAEYYRADCLHRAGKTQEALEGFERTVDAAPDQLLEPALAAAATIQYGQGAWSAALEHYTQLEQRAALPVNVLAAQIGRLRCLSRLQRIPEAAAAGQQLLDNKDATDDLKAEAGLAIALAAVNNNDLDAAFARYKSIAAASSNESGAEAAYQKAYVRYLQQRYGDAEKEVFALVKQFPSHDHWKAKAFILLGDAYAAMNDVFQAKATLQSVVDHCTEPDLVAEASQRLARLNDQPAGPAPSDSVPAPGTK